MFKQNLGADEPVAASAQGQLTVTSSKKLGTSDWITKVYFYDAKGQVVQEQSNNATNVAMNDVHTNVFDFAGLLKRSVNKKTVNTTVHTVDENMTYDNGARLASVSHKYNANAAVVIADYVYNELGQLVDKNLGKLAPNSYLQSVDLRYNIRGWLRGINNADLSNDGYNTETNDVFGMELLYQTTDAGIGNTGLYNGQVSGVKWKAKMTGHTFTNIGRAYVYSYDKLGQLRNALFKGNNGSGWTYRNGVYDEKNISYDLNGNILSLERNMMNVTSGAVIQMYNLSYAYKTTGGNDKLQQVNDAWAAAGSYGFKGVSTATEEYVYDVNGNLTEDKNKNMTYSYNDLGKVNRVTLLAFTNRYIQYNYDGSGVCLSKQVVDNGSTVKTTTYLAGFVAVDNVLSYINTAEGRVRTASGVGTYEYYIKDHLGNVRVSFENVGGVASVRQENSFYAFGLVHNGSIVPSGANKEIVADGEWENDFGNDPDLYTMPYRQYDPVLGRFNAVDPMAEKYQDLTVYNFCFNNPVSFSDPSGADPIGSWDDLWNIILQLWNSPYGGTWSMYGTRPNYFADKWDALWNYDKLYPGAWASTMAGSFDQAYMNLAANRAAAERDMPTYGLRTVEIQETYSNSNWLVDRQKEAFGVTNTQYKVAGANKGGEGGSYTSKALAASAVLLADDVTGIGAIDDVAIPVIIAGAAVRDLTQIKYITYTLKNASGKTYIGRSSGYGDPYSIMMNRYYSHDMRALGYGDPQLDRVAQGWPLGYYAIRGIEQDGIDAYGGIGSPILGNRINGIWEYNINRPLYMGASKVMFGPYVK